MNLATMLDLALLALSNHRGVGTLHVRAIHTQPPFHDGNLEVLLTQFIWGHLTELMSHLGTLAEHFHLGFLLDHVRTQIFVSLSRSHLYLSPPPLFFKPVHFFERDFGKLGNFVANLRTFGALFTGLNCAVEPKK